VVVFLLGYAGVCGDGVVVGAGIGAAWAWVE
jgi:hypothetical protein